MVGSGSDALALRASTTAPDRRFNRYDGPPGTDPKIAVARILKALNPRIKLLWYQAADFVSQSSFVTGQIAAHPEWWLRDDSNSTVFFQGVPELDWSVPAARAWFIRLPAAGLLSPAEEAALVDGLFVDSAGYGYWPSGISQARYDASLFPGKMALMEEATAYYGALNGGNVCVPAAGRTRERRFRDGIRHRLSPPCLPRSLLALRPPGGATRSSSTATLAVCRRRRLTLTGTRLSGTTRQPLTKCAALVLPALLNRGLRGGSCLVTLQVWRIWHPDTPADWRVGHRQDGVQL